MYWLQALVFCAGLAGASVYDIKKRLVDNRVCAVIALAGLVSISPASFLGAVAAALPFYVGSVLRMNGAGDIRLALAAGFVLGFERSIAGLAFFSVLYAVFVLCAALAARVRNKPCPASFPLVPFIAAGFIPAHFLF